MDSMVLDPPSQHQRQQQRAQPILPVAAAAGHEAVAEVDRAVAVDEDAMALPLRCRLLQAAQAVPAVGPAVVVAAAAQTARSQRPRRAQMALAMVLAAQAAPAPQVEVRLQTGYASRHRNE